MQKKIGISIFLIIVSMFAFYIPYNIYNNENFNDLLYAEETITSSKIVISSGNINQNNVYNIIKTLLDKYNGNIYFTRIGKNNFNVKNNYIKYVYINNLDYFYNFKIFNGRIMNKDDMETNRYLSTIDMDDEFQIGVLQDFAGDDLLEIRSFISMIDNNLTIYGTAIVDFKTMQNTDLFVKDLNEFGIYCNKEKIVSINSMPYDKFFYSIIIILYLLFMLYIFYSILNDYKSIGIKKMFGFYNAKVWFEMIKPIIFMKIIIIPIVSLVLTFINIKQFNEYSNIFLRILLIQNIIFIIISLILISIPFLYLPKIKISNIIKNKVPVKEIILTNNIIKVFLSAIIIAILFNVFSNYYTVSLKYSNTIDDWEKTKNLAFIPTIQDIPSSDFLYSLEFRNIQEELYVGYNKLGSVLADFNIFAPNIRDKGIKNQPLDYIRDLVEVNPNYLNENIILDAQGNRIFIDEDEDKYILLIPEMYKTYKEDIIKHHEFLKNARGEKSKVKIQDIKILWIEDDQKLFTYRIDIEPSSGSKVSNAIIRVITLSNGDFMDFDRIIAYSGNPFKIRIENSENPALSIRPLLEKYDLSQYIKTISIVYDSMENELNKIINFMNLLFMLMLAFSCILIFIIIFNIKNFFQEQKISIAIRILHGHNMINRYNNYFILVGIGFGITLIISLLLHLNNIIPILIITIIVAIFELMVSFFIIKVIEKRNLSKVLKGG